MNSEQPLLLIEDDENLGVLINSSFNQYYITGYNL